MIEAEIKKLEKAVFKLTEAIQELTSTLQSPGNSGKASKAVPTAHNGNRSSTPGPKSVCLDTHCGAINSDSITCEHTLARYKSEYLCG